MPTLWDLVPDVGVFLTLTPEELALPLLKAVKSALQNRMIHRSNFRIGRSADEGRNDELELAVSEAWSWLLVQGILVPAPGMNGTNGWCVVSRRGQALVTDEDFNRFRQAAMFPKSMLHAAIADKVWVALARGDLADAVFVAFRAVEEAVRKAGGYSDSAIGVPLMRNAFKPADGPLVDQEQEGGEREALCAFFAGAIGSYKNPHSHRTVNITDPLEAQEMVIIASHLRIVDARAAIRSGPGISPP